MTPIPALISADGAPSTIVRSIAERVERYFTNATKSDAQRVASTSEFPARARNCLTCAIQGACVRMDLYGTAMTYALNRAIAETVSAMASVTRNTSLSIDKTSHSTETALMSLREINFRCLNRRRITIFR